VIGPAAKPGAAAPAKPSARVTAAVRTKLEKLAFIVVSRFPRIGCIRIYGAGRRAVLPARRSGCHVLVRSRLTPMNAG
jgi:hypothetical protein